eukprot:TRINITY_DN56044_c0_g1_i1.p1 TRINITY_DN56044_c0_g1~~TRINITY_DN56044_c0_g1_i1.p1  ORF type:complete len:264 (+),score=49.68 TRINITY_DN56044_c0_g1_i1:73-864(+)
MEAGGGVDFDVSELLGWSSVALLAASHVAAVARRWAARCGPAPAVLGTGIVGDTANLLGALAGGAPEWQTFVAIVQLGGWAAAAAQLFAANEMRAAGRAPWQGAVADERSAEPLRWVAAVAAAGVVAALTHAAAHTGALGFVSGEDASDAAELDPDLERATAIFLGAVSAACSLAPRLIRPLSWAPAGGAAAAAEAWCCFSGNVCYAAAICAHPEATRGVPYWEESMPWLLGSAASAAADARHLPRIAELAGLQSGKPEARVV